MSGKSTGLVWDMRLRRDLKYVLLAYVDHADHEGKNIHPGIALIVWKTEYSETEVHRCVKELIAMGLLVEDGTGPHGTKNYSLGYQIGTLPKWDGAKGKDKGGAIPASQLPDLGMGMAPELNGTTVKHTNEEEELIKILTRAAESAFPARSQHKNIFISEIGSAALRRDGNMIVVSGLKSQAEIFEDAYTNAIQRALIGTLKEKTTVRFEA